MGYVSLIDGHIENAEHCVCCGQVIPEGSQYCIVCGYKVKQEPKIDFVNVVRCKDCKHWIYWADEKRCSCDLHHTHTSRNDFCSYGERKETK